MYISVFKRLIDVFLSLVGIIVLSPLLFVIAVFIKLNSRGPVIFKQKRVGKNKTYFNIYKFRTMRINAPNEMPTHLFSDSDKYITKVGKLLRRTGLDELPQMLNIFKGDMSLIGPRPALWNQFDLIAERDKYGANDVLPGLTGLAQISGKGRLSNKEKAWLDGKYAKKISFLFDCECFFGTIYWFFNHSKASSKGERETKSVHDKKTKEVNKK